LSDLKAGARSLSGGTSTIGSIPEWVSLVLKEGGGRAAGLAVGLGVALCFLYWFDLAPGLPPWAVPAMVIAICVFGCVAVASLAQHVARRMGARDSTFSNWRDRLKWRRKLRALPPSAHQVLAVMEEDGLDTLVIDPRHKGVKALRDAGLLAVFSTGGGGRFYLPHDHKLARDRHQAMFRAELQCSQEDAQRIRAEIANAIRKAGESWMRI
jgi:hypothetical protein